MKIDADVIRLLKTETENLVHGIVTLSIHIHDGHDTRYVLNREISIVPGRPTSGAGQGAGNGNHQ